MEVKEILKKVQDGNLSIEEAEKYFRRQPFEEMGYAKLDTHRKIRSGFAEVIFCSGKANEHLLNIFGRLYEQDGEVFGTRATQSQYELIRKQYPQTVFDPISKIIKIEKKDCGLYSWYGGYCGCRRSGADRRIFWRQSRADI